VTDTADEQLLQSVEALLQLRKRSLVLRAEYSRKKYRLGTTWDGGRFLEIKQRWSSGRFRIVRFEYGPTRDGAKWYGGVFSQNARGQSRHDSFDPSEKQLRYYSRFITKLSWRDNR